ncbi:MAG: hypothetical protein KatS3mg040_1294 [Candidatus Kapaibacterium sp.]|nr:MAG: hypothetical protein KatS3mg040_1294 [Candidatus Kapabacteria bacterium]
MTNDRTRRLQQVLVLSGNPERAIAAFGGELDVQPHPIEEFAIAKPATVLALFRALRGKQVVIVTKDLRYQRFRTIWKLYSAIAGHRNWMFVDEQGRCDRFSWLKLFAIELPLLVLEGAVSLVGVFVGWIRLRFYRAQCR